MSYELQFLPSALKEWRKLGFTVREQFKAKLAERLQAPHVPADRLAGSEMKDCYKIKLRASGYRLVYRVSDAAITVTVVAVGKRDRQAVYRTAQKR
ncbi:MULTISPECIES: type II toxin-antitoxin system RelE family toxin [unclassified Methylobacterium]|jgi:mRNA interferase RelE/StbE|uniref:type II toxin-antitoxin system RelE family toxin n=1 Tax=unclassified Methylobacterium TaxID=2615210 RepID=UPI001353AB62|nr:type II toxin-antitoxin system RelE/ParE family toxin [Methylobacterium sp. 2A]MWV26233.1 type II toxin-antitoxin system RelE/ParE family toxin [Methylobacterium sp. 2A]